MFDVRDDEPRKGSIEDSCITRDPCSDNINHAPPTPTPTPPYPTGCASPFRCSMPAARRSPPVPCSVFCALCSVPARSPPPATLSPLPLCPLAAPPVATTLVRHTPESSRGLSEYLNICCSLQGGPETRVVHTALEHGGRTCRTRRETRGEESAQDVRCAEMAGRTEASRGWRT